MGMSCGLTAGRDPGVAGGLGQVLLKAVGWPERFCQHYLICVAGPHPRDAAWGPHPHALPAFASLTPVITHI